ncbi:hypothetical protein D3C87_1488130 [compost metagenome]
MKRLRNSCTNGRRCRPRANSVPAMMLQSVPVSRQKFSRRIAPVCSRNQWLSASLAGCGAQLSRPGSATTDSPPRVSGCVSWRVRKIRSIISALSSSYQAFFLTQLVMRTFSEPLMKNPWPSMYQVRMDAVGLAIRPVAPKSTIAADFSKRCTRASCMNNCAWTGCMQIMACPGRACA